MLRVTGIFNDLHFSANTQSHTVARVLKPQTHIRKGAHAQAHTQHAKIEFCWIFTASKLLLPHFSSCFPWRMGSVLGAGHLITCTDNLVTTGNEMQRERRHLKSWWGDNAKWGWDFHLQAFFFFPMCDSFYIRTLEGGRGGESESCVAAERDRRKTLKSQHCPHVTRHNQQEDISQIDLARVPLLYQCS